MDDAKLQKLLDQQEERMQRYVGAIKEDFDGKLDTALESIQSVSVLKTDMDEVKTIVKDIQPTVDATFERVGELSVSVKNIEETLATHDQQIRSIK